jgi:hypothetical protein
MRPIHLVPLLTFLVHPTLALDLNVDDYPNGTSGFTAFYLPANAYPRRRRFPLTFSDQHSIPLHDVYLGHRLYRTDASMAFNSSLWFFFSSMKVDGARMEVGHDPPQVPNLLCEHLEEYSHHTCTFHASVRNQTYVVSLFSDTDITTVPYSLYSDILINRLHTIRLQWNHSVIDVHGPFSLGRGEDVLLSNQIRHTYTFHFAMSSPPRVHVWKSPPLSIVIRIALTIACCICLVQCVGMIESSSRWPYLWIGGAFLWIQHPVRAVWIVSIALGRWGIHYAMLEALWTFTMILGERNSNICSVSISVVLFTSAWIQPPWIPRMYLTVFVALHLYQYLDGRLSTLVGIPISPLVLLILTWVLSVSIHLRQSLSLRSTESSEFGGKTESQELAVPFQPRRRYSRTHRNGARPKVSGRNSNV